MKRNIMAKNLGQSIIKSFGRYIAIVAIIALGAGIFVGLRSTKSDMVATGQVFMDKQNMFDLRLISACGWGEDELAAVSLLHGIAQAEGVKALDVIAALHGSEEEVVLKLHSIPSMISKVRLLGGRMPQNAQECLIDGFFGGEQLLGSTVTLSSGNSEDTLDSLHSHSFTVVGYVSSPLYMDMSRGTTTLGNGSVSAYVYVPMDAFNTDYYSEIQVTVPGDYAVYTQQYDDAMTLVAEQLEPLLQRIAQQRLDQLRADAEQAYADGMAEYTQGLEEYQTARTDAFRELANARLELEDGEKEIADNRQTIEDSLLQLDEGQKELDQNALILSESRQQLAQSKAEAYEQLAKANSELLENYKTVSASIKQLEDGLSQINDGIAQLDSGITQLESGLEQLELMLSLMDTMIGVMDTGIETAQSALDQALASGADADTVAQLQESLDTYAQRRDGYVAQKAEYEINKTQYTEQLAQLKQQRQDLQTQKSELEGTKATLDDAMAQLELGMLEMENQQTQINNQFASAEAQIDAGQAQLDAAQHELDAGKRELQNALAALDSAQAEIESGWEEYQAGREEAIAEFDKAKQELADAEAELADARRAIDDMDTADVYCLDRNTNVGYLSLDSNSDIVEGVSTVFPVFFLLIAALVCITTMTRMVEEERTQIGTLKALGYANGAIIGKYLAYAGSAAVIGCGLGVVAGSIVFPVILWHAYSLILYITPNILLQVNCPLCLAVVAVYTAVTLLVTWYCCRMTLREAPAQLIRPKAPAAGKKIFLEYLPFWNKLRFLNKVMLRNIFRYHQRLLMMLMGIGGCTALLLTGFGLRDSIVDIVDYQFSEVTLFDIEVRFADPLTEDAQNRFAADFDGDTRDICFYHQSSVELEFDGKVRDITFMAAPSALQRFMDFHSGERSLDMPATGEALLSVGMAQMLGIREGDTVTVRDSDMRSLTVTVAGIFDNHVYNYLLVSPKTVEQAWGTAPQVQMACLTVADGVDAHALGADISQEDGVMSITICDDTAEQVGSMLEALDLVVATVVVCAGLLAVTVLYNLTNINITERIREIATIKVLGFRAGESAAYVFKENLLLSAMGSILGLGGGIALLEFVMSKIRIDMVWLEARLLPMSFVWAVVLTMLSACLVDFALYFKLERINMAEALKSVE